MAPDAAQRTPPELLAPAGDWEALRSAVANGADAIYFGLTDFNARLRAANFTLDNLSDVLIYLHGHNVRGYVTFNTLIFSDELPRAAEYAARIAESGADAVIVQDIGLIRLIRRIAPTLPIHASTQTTQTEPQGIELLRALGVRRVILARELSLEEIARLAAATPLPLEVFVHGALCVSYSGQCLASEALGGRSANRGLCAQACRLPYQLVVDGRLQDLGDRRYLLSPQDLAAHELIPELVRLGVAALKIEGRLKDAAYVAAATRVYRAAIDAALRGESASLAPEDAANLALTFSRGLGRGYLDGVDHRVLVPGRSSKKRGLLIGTVVAKTRRGLVVEPLEPSARQVPSALAGGYPRTPSLTGTTIKPGDGVVFDEGRPDQEEQGGRVYQVHSATAGQIELVFGRDDRHLGAVSIGSRVWKTDDPAVRRRLEDSFRRDTVVRRVPLRAGVAISRNLRGADQELFITITFMDPAGRTSTVAWDEPLRRADQHPLSLPLLREQLSRLGNTPFELGAVELTGPDGPAESVPVMIPKSVLNDLRRRAVQKLRDRRDDDARHPLADPDALTALRREIHSARPAGAGDAPQLHVLVRTVEQLDAVLQYAPSGCPPLAMTYGDFPNPPDYARALARARAAGRPIAFAGPRILMPGEEGALDSLAALDPDAMLIRNLGSFAHLRNRYPQLTLIGDHSLNVANEITAALLREQGLARLTPGHDLNTAQLSALVGLTPPANLEIVLHLHIPMFHTRHCLFAAALTNAASCAGCPRPCAQHDVRLRDRLGVNHPLLTDAAGRNTVFHAAVQSAAELVPSLLGHGVHHFRVELLNESADVARSLVEIYTRLLSALEVPSVALHRLRSVASTPVTLGTLGFD